jgi:hypothetical protein
MFNIWLVVLLNCFAAGTVDMAAAGRFTLAGNQKQPLPFPIAGSKALD